MTTTSTTSVTQSLVSALGAGSGVDMAALATNLATAQFASRVDRLTTKSETLTAQISSASNIKSMLMNLSTSLGDMVRTGSLSPKPQVANPSVASASLSGTRQPSGSYSLEVTALAKGQTLASPKIGAKEPVGAGKLTLRFGAVDADPFVDDPDQKPLTLDVPAGATLADVATLINGKNAGVTAYVASTPAGAQLVLKGKEGAASGFVVEAAETSGSPGLSRLAWAPGAPGQSQLLASASDAAFKVDGLPLTAASNTLTDVIPGVTLKLAATTDKPTTVSFADTSASITSAMTDLTGALNEIAAALNTATEPNTGELRADSGARAFKLKMSQLAGSAVMPSATGAAKTLADLGLSTQRDGTFVLDNKRLAATIASDPEGVAAMFTNGLYGVFSSIDKLYRGVSSSSDPGSLGGSIARFNKQLAQASEDKTELADKQETLRASLTARFARSDTRISQSQATLSFLQNQIDAWNKSDN